MSIMIGNIEGFRKRIMRIFPSSIGGVYPIILEVNDIVKKLDENNLVPNPNGIIVSKDENIAIQAEIGYKPVIYVESKSHLAVLIVHKKQLKLFSERIFKEIFKHFKNEEVRVHVLTHDRSKKTISLFVSQMFTMGNITSYQVTTFSEKVSAIFY